MPSRIRADGRGRAWPAPARELQLQKCQIIYYGLLCPVHSSFISQYAHELWSHGEPRVVKDFTIQAPFVPGEEEKR